MSNCRFPCACCGYLTVEHPGGYEICPICGWEDDVVQNEDPDYRGGANRPSLKQAILNFERFGATEERFVSRTREPWPEEVPPDR